MKQMKLIIGVVVTLALLISGVAYLLLIEWPSTEAPPLAPHEASLREAPQSVETVLLRSGEPTRTDEPWSGGYLYDVRFYDASDNEAAMVAASIRKEASQPQYRLTVDLAHHIETWEIKLDGDPSVTHLEWLSLAFKFNRQIQGFPSPLWLLTPAGYFGPFSSAFLLESRRIDTDDRRTVLLLNFTQLRNLENPPTSPEPWSWISFQFLMTPESPEFAQPHFNAFTLEISFALHRVLDGGKVISHYEKGTTKPLKFQLPPSLASSTIREVPVATPMLPLSRLPTLSNREMGCGLTPTYMLPPDYRTIFHPLLNLEMAL